MLEWCAYCQKFQGEVPPFDSYRLTHGLCASCSQKGLEFSDEEFAAITRIKNLQDSLLKAGLAGDAEAAIDRIKSAKSDGLAEVDIFIGVMAPLLWHMGELWARGAISVAEEHRFTSFYEKVLASFAKAESASGPVDIILLNATDNLHVTGVRLMDLWLRSKGVRVAVMSRDLSCEEVAANVKNFKASYLGFSVALAEHLPGVEKFVQKLQALLGSSSPKIIIGGNAVKLGAAKCEIEAQFISDPREVLRLLSEKK